MHHSSIDPHVLVQSDRLCDEFERRFKQGETPRIADFLSRIDAEHRRTLWHDLVALEVGLLAAKGESKSVEEMLERYESIAPPGTDRQSLKATIERALGSAADTSKFEVGDAPTSPWEGATRKTITIVAPVIDGFEISDLLGKGGMGVVFKAVQTSLDRTVALKVILERDADAWPVHLERFAREAKAVAEFNDPHFVQIYEFGESRGKPYMALEFVAGGSLEKYREGAPQALEFAGKTVEILARAMHKAHAAGLVHRDLKPHNVLLAGDGTPKITDFGLVKRLDRDESQMTREGAVVGTASYMAPEQTYDSHDVGPASDIYALGGILYCLLTGRPPFLGATPHDTIFDVRNTEVVPPSRLRPNMPRDLEVICLACLEKEPTKRYGTALDLADDLRRYLEGRPITRRPISALERTWRWSKHNPMGATVAALVVAIAVTTSFMSWRLTVLNSAANFARRSAEEERGKATVAQRNAEEERRKAVAAQTAKSEQFNESMRLYYTVLSKVDSRLRNSSRDVKLRNEINQLAVKSLDRVKDVGEKNTLYDRNEAIAAQRLGDMYLLMGSLKQALEQYDRSYEIIRETQRKAPDERVHERNLASISDKQAESLERLGQTLRARDKFAEALRARQSWHKKLQGETVDDSSAKAQIAKSYYQLGRIYLRLGHAEEALDHLKLAKDWYQLVGPNTAVQLVSIEQRLGEAYYQIGDADQAERSLSAVVTECTNKHKRTPSVGNRKALADSWRELGDLYMNSRRDVAKARDHYKLALDEHRRLWEADKESAEYRSALASTEYRVGALLLRAREAGEVLDVPGGNDARTHFERSCELRGELATIDPDDMQAKIEWALALARADRAIEAVAQAATLLEAGLYDPRLLSQAAATLALCTEASNEELRNSCRERAYKVLDQLIRAGWKDRVVLRDDPDFDPIRQEPRFQQVLASLPPSRGSDKEAAKE